ncbi:hypothetical protein Tco_0775007 [Tanacetum coccineum]
MSMMGELKFFLRLQVHQSPRGIFISQSQYAIELLNKYGLDECVSMSTPMATKRLYADLQGTPTDQMTYRHMIGGLMYLTASRPDISFATFVCARYQARLTVKHLKEVKQIFWYLRQSYNMGLWYTKDSGFELIAYSDADHAGCKDDCKSTLGGLQFLGPWQRLCKISPNADNTGHWMGSTAIADVPLTLSQPTESTQGTHRTPSAPRSPNPNKEAAESSAPRRSTVIRLLSLAEHKSHEEYKARENVALVDEHLASEEIEKMVDGHENVVDDSSIPRNDDSNIPGTGIEPRSNKESPEAEITKDKEVEITKDKEVEITKDKEVEITKETLVVDITNMVIPVNVNDEDEEITDEARFMPRKSFNTLADNLHDVMVETLPIMVDKHIKEQVMKQVPKHFRNQVPVYVAEGLILERKNAKEEMERLIAKAILQEDQQYQLYLAMKADPQLQQQDIAIWLALQMKFERNTVPQTACRTPAVRPRDQDDPHDDAHPEGENSAKRQKTSEYEAYVSGESSSGQVFQEEQAPSTSGNQEQDDDFDFWTDSYASDDDEIPTKQVSQDIMEEVSLTIDEAKLRKMADEMLRQRCTSGDEHQYHIDQMKNFLKSDIVWESRKEILVSPHPRKTTPLVHSCQKDPEAPALSLINQDLLYLKKGNSGPEKIVLSLHKFPAVIFNDDDIEERTSRWVNKCVRKFNPYARYGVEHWKNPHAKIFYIRKQKEPGKPKEEVYSNSKIIQVVKTYWELGHEHKFITEIVARRANKYLVSITKPDYKNLNKNDIEDIYLFIMNGKVPDYADTRLLWSLSVFIRSTVKWERVHDFQLGIESYQQKVNLTVPTMTFPGIENHEMFSIIYEPMHGIIDKNSKKDKRYGYVQKDLTKDEAEYLKLFEEEIEERLKHRR